MNRFFSCLLVLLLFSSKSFGQEPAKSNQLNLTQARQYMLELINRDRQKMNLEPVTFDDIASKAGQSHAEEMVTKSYHGHYDISGHKPWQRYSDAGGSGYVSENAHYEKLSYGPLTPLPNGDSYTLEDNPIIDKRSIERAETAFINEVPPNDGHRRNVLNPVHDGVGIGIAVAKNGDNSSVALVQEFTENKAEYEQIPKQIVIGKDIEIKGTFKPGFQLYEITLKWDKTPKPMTPDEICKTFSYALPEKTIETYWPPPYTSPKPIKIEGKNNQTFSLTITPDSSFKPGLYYIQIWAKPDNNKEPFPASIRTMILPET